jgi:hypothetical protein
MKDLQAVVSSTGWSAQDGINVAGRVTHGIVGAIDRRVVIPLTSGHLATLLEYAIRYDRDEFVSALRGRTWVALDRKELDAMLRQMADIIDPPASTVVE